MVSETYCLDASLQDHYFLTNILLLFGHLSSFVDDCVTNHAVEIAQQ